MTYAEKVFLLLLTLLRTDTFSKYVGFWLAYTLPTIVFCLCPIILWAGRNRYVRSTPTGSVLGSAIRILRYCMRGRWSFHPYILYKNVKSDDFWETVKRSNVQGDRPSWMTFDDQWVDEVRRGFKACAVFCWFPLYCMITVFLFFRVTDTLWT
jgi:proton-dependent oligopeptide transporter, POT family